MRLTSWDGPLPLCGEFMRAPTGTTYAVLSMRQTRPGSKSVATLQMLRLGASEPLPDRAVVHHFIWNSRSKRRVQ